MAELTEQDTKFCSNCKKDISTANFMMHEVHCRRHILLCEQCEEPIPRAEIEQHFQDQHVKITCAKCGQGVEKSKIETHQENECPKKPLKCLYCELEFPKNELAPHLDYCGSRTEQCVMCSQFIMLKDQIRHEDSNCTIPVPKPTNGGSTFNNSHNYLGGFDQSPYLASSSPEDEALFGPVEEYFNPFAFEEMSRLLNNQSDAETRLSGHTGLARHQARQVNVNSSSPSSRPGNLNRRNEYVPAKPSNVSTSVSRLNRRKPDVNRHRDTGASPGSLEGQATSTMDHLLALHLAQDLNQSEDFHYRDPINMYEGEDFMPLSTLSALSTSPLSPEYQDYTRSGVDIHPALVGSDEHEEALIPCEFCGEAFPAEVFLRHQNGCNDSPPAYSATEEVVLFGDSPPDVEQYYRLSPKEMGRDIAPEEPAINSSRVTTSQHTPPDIPIVDNLSHAVVQDWVSSSLPSESVCLEREDPMLPCEFCGALLPLDYLVQHQLRQIAPQGEMLGFSKLFVRGDCERGKRGCRRRCQCPLPGNDKAICDADSSVSPRNQSPAVQPLQPKQKNSNILRPANTGTSSSQSTHVPTRSQRRQLDPIEQITQGSIFNTNDNSDGSGRTSNHAPTNTRLAKARQTKNVNLCNNSSATSPNTAASSIGPTGVANIRKTLSKYGTRDDGKYGVHGASDDSKHTTPPAARSRRRLSAETLDHCATGTTPEPSSRTQRSNSLTKTHQILDSFLDEEENGGSPLTGGVNHPPVPVSKKAVKQNDNRAKQTAATMKGPGMVRPKAPTVRHTAVPAREAARDDPLPTGLQGSTPKRNARPAVPESRAGLGTSAILGTDGRPPRRSGNRVFAGQTKRTSTSKRNLPEGPS